jgi:CelD/BcsL family acetyltransferase involved in cellulose biosynthesis/GNAT superfamily N-acetyltransferase
MDEDPVSTFFQSPVWCMEWYRSYQDKFRPLVMIAARGESLVGIVPLAVEITTGRLAFAGDNMSDYRDVAAAPGYREGVIAELIRLHRSGQYPNFLRIGPTQPESETLQIVRALCRKGTGARAIARFHPCWRLWFSPDGSTKKLTSKESVRRHISYYKRQGAVALERIRTKEAWDAVKQEFFDQHSLRQLQASRPVSFDDPRKREFHDALLQRGGDSIRVSALRVGGRLLAAHYGYVWKGVLYWGAPAFDVREEKHSPGQILLALLLQEAEASGLRGVDFTLGTEEFKKRFGNSCVDLPSVEIYSGARRYFARRLRDRVVSGAKSATIKVAGAPNWEKSVEGGKAAAAKARRAYELGLGDSLSRLARRGLSALGDDRRGLIFIATPADVRQVAPSLVGNETSSFHTDEVGDLLRWEGGSRSTASEIETTVKGVADSLRKGHTLHTVLVNDRLAGWGWSYWPQEPAFITETQTTLAFEPGSVSLYGFYVLPEFRGRKLYQALLSRILNDRFAEGAERAYIMCLETNVASRKAIERAGFRLVSVHRFSRVLWKKRRQEQESGASSRER